MQESYFIINHVADYFKLFFPMLVIGPMLGALLTILDRKNVERFGG